MCEMVLEGFLIFFIILQTVKYKSSSLGLFVSFSNAEDLTCKLRVDSLYVGMVCLKLKQLNLFEISILLGFMVSMCPFMNHFLCRAQKF